MDVELIDKMGSDLSVVNAARVSFAKIKDKFEDKDEKLIKYLAVHGHWSPFAHASLSFRIKAPVFVARQLVKHQVGLSWNEVSRRYVDDETKIINDAEEMYNDMLADDIAPEMARMILPQCMMTEWIWSGSLYAFARVCNLRNKENAQVETRMVTHHISKHMKDHFPICVRYLLDG